MVVDIDERVLVLFGWVDAGADESSEARLREAFVPPAQIKSNACDANPAKAQGKIVVPYPDSA